VRRHNNNAIGAGADTSNRKLLHKAGPGFRLIRHDGLLNRTTINVVDMGALHPMADDNCWYQAIAQGIADFVFLAAPKYKKPNQAAGLSELQQKRFYWTRVTLPACGPFCPSTISNST
jgi:hypothetical protein